MSGLHEVRPMRAVGALLDMVVRQHDALGDADLPDLTRGLAGQDRASVFGYLGLAAPEDYQADLAEQTNLGEGSRALSALTWLSMVVDAAVVGDDAAMRDALVRLGADVVRWVQAVDNRAGAGS